MRPLFFALLLCLFCCASCEQHTNYTGTNHTATLVHASTDSVSIYIWEIDGHLYGAMHHGGLTHLESCQCKGGVEKHND